MTVSDIIVRLQQAGITRVALQAPEGLKRRLPYIARELRTAGFEVTLSGEPCYGACDLDIHARDMAEVLIHIGHAPVDNTPGVWYEPWAVDVDTEKIRNAFSFLTEKKIGLVTTVQHVHLLEKVRKELEKAGYQVITAKGSERTPYHGQVLGCSFDAAKNCHTREILFFGTGVFHPIGIAIATHERVIACDPITGNIEEITSERFLRKRFAIIERAKHAERYGIIVSPKTGQDRIDYAKSLANHHPNADIITMREVSSDQMLNLGYPVYVNTACPRLAYDDQIRFPVPLISPQEFEIVCGVRPWEDYELDEIP